MSHFKWILSGFQIRIFCSHFIYEYRVLLFIQISVFFFWVCFVFILPALWEKSWLRIPRKNEVGWNIIHALSGMMRIGRISSFWKAKRKNISTSLDIFSFSCIFFNVRSFERKIDESWWKCMERYLEQYEKNAIWMDDHWKFLAVRWCRDWYIVADTVHGIPHLDSPCNDSTLCDRISDIRYSTPHLYTTNRRRWMKIHRKCILIKKPEYSSGFQSIIYILSSFFHFPYRLWVWWDQSRYFPWCEESRSQ